MSLKSQALVEHGWLEGEHKPIDEPGMEYSFTIIPDDTKYCPTCVCKTRTCPLHGFCQLCAQHHADICRVICNINPEADCHVQHCVQDKITARSGAAAAAKAARDPALETLEAARKARAMLEEKYK